jgi:SAM-dependent methyltransferase
LTDDLALAYSTSAGAWQNGPGCIYDRLAEVIVARSPVPVGGRAVLDVGAGTGAATRAALAAGAVRVVALDAAIGMLAHGAARRPPAVVGDARALPFAAASFDVAVSAFSLNHLVDPTTGLREMARVTRSGGALVAATYAADDTHPVKGAVEGALADRGWSPEPWYEVLRSEAAPVLATPEGFASAAATAGLEARVEPLRVAFPDLEVPDLVVWRLGLAQHAPFVARLSHEDREAVASEAAIRLGEEREPLVRSILVLGALRP